MTPSQTFEQAVCVSDVGDRYLDAIARDCSAHEVAQRIAALSGLNVTDTQAHEWLMEQHGACDSCHERAGTNPMCDGKRFCPQCCSSAVAYDDREND